MIEKPFSTTFLFARDDFFELLEISEWSFGEVRRIFWENKAREWDLVPDVHKGWYSVGSMGKDFKLRVDLPNTMRASIFTSIYFFFEEHLDSICTHFQYKEQLETAPQDLSDLGITRSQKYLKKVAKVSFPDTSEEWRKIKTYNKIRNYIAHSGGVVPLEDDYKFQKRLSEIDGASIAGGSKLRFESNFCLKFLHTINDFMKNLTESLEEENPFWEREDY